jgi:hypothetical protein
MAVAFWGPPSELLFCSLARLGHLLFDNIDPLLAPSLHSHLLEPLLQDLVSLLNDLDVGGFLVCHLWTSYALSSFFPTSNLRRIFKVSCLHSYIFPGRPHALKISNNPSLQMIPESVSLVLALL